MTCPKKNCPWYKPEGYLPFQRCVCERGFSADKQILEIQFIPEQPEPLTGICDKCSRPLQFMPIATGRVIVKCPYEDCRHEMEVEL